jgi:hypothetical protein
MEESRLTPFLFSRKAFQIDDRIYSELEKTQKELGKEGFNPLSVNDIVEIAIRAFLALPRYSQVEIIGELKDDS